MQANSYLVQKDDKSFCPYCRGKVDLLCTSSLLARRPWFYICWTCKKVFQLGVGECSNKCSERD